MKKYVSLVCCVFFLLGMGSVNAQEINKKFNGSIGLQTYHYEYTEPGFMENEGIFYGISYSLTYTEGNVSIGLEGLLAYGAVDYTSTSTGSLNGIDDICADNRLLLGVKIYDENQIQLIPFAGIAYRFLQDNSEDKRSTTNVPGYVRQSNYLYSPIGMKLKINYDNGWSLTPEAEYDCFWFGRQESGLGYTAANREDITNDQEEGFGYRFALTVAKKTAKTGFSLQVFYRYWEIDNSKVTVDSFGNPWIEPENETSEYGLNIAVLF